MAKNIFLSYSRKDKAFARKLAKDLENAGHTVWWDLTNIDGGDRWAREIQDGINQSEILAVVVSPNSINSEWVEKEFIFASKRGMKIVPLLYEHCELPIWLLNLQYVDIVGMNYERNFKQVLESFERYGRRTEDIKSMPMSIRKRMGKLFSSKLFLFSLLALFVLTGVYSAPYIKKTLSPIPTNTPTAPIPSATATTIPTETATPSPTKTATPSPTPTRTPPPSKTPTSEPLASLVVDASGAEMLLVNAGSFLMGSDGGDVDEKPAHTVQLDDYYIDAYEVTNAEYKVCVDALECPLPKNTIFYISTSYRNHPVVFVNWEMAVDFCEWREARLPTEAEWEKAARGTNNLYYPWGWTFSGNILNYCDLECEHSWADESFRDRYTRTAPVGTYPDGQSVYGVFDMAGNAAEWVADWYAKDYYPISSVENPFGPEFGTYRVLRGGSWYSRKLDVRTFVRSHLRPETAYNYTGFRCASSVVP